MQRDEPQSSNKQLSTISSRQTTSTAPDTESSEHLTFCLKIEAELFFYILLKTTTTTMRTQHGHAEFENLADW